MLLWEHWNVILGREIRRRGGFIARLRHADTRILGRERRLGGRPCRQARRRLRSRPARHQIEILDGKRARALWHRRRGARVLEAAFMIDCGESRARWWAHQRGYGVEGGLQKVRRRDSRRRRRCHARKTPVFPCPSIVKLFQLLVLLWLLRRFLIEGQDIDEDLGMFSCVLLGDTALVDEPLPLLG